MLRSTVIVTSVPTITGVGAVPITASTAGSAPISRPRSKMIFQALDAIPAGTAYSSCE